MLNGNAQKWVEALRSDEYEQGSYALHQIIDGTNRFCCLGVACKLAADEGVVQAVSNEDIFTYGNSVNSNENSGAFLPIKVRDWLGLKTDRGSFEDGTSLTHLNDTREYSFKEIADVIESEPEGLFNVV